MNSLACSKKYFKMTFCYLAGRNHLNMYYLNVAAEIKTYSIRQRYSNVLPATFGEPVQIVASVLKHLVWSSVAVKVLFCIA